jgi:hypothetical protein
MHYKALITSVVIYACLAWEYAADANFMALQCLQNSTLRTGNRDRRTPVRELQMTITLVFMTI